MSRTFFGAAEGQHELRGLLRAEFLTATPVQKIRQALDLQLQAFRALLRGFGLLLRGFGLLLCGLGLFLGRVELPIRVVELLCGSGQRRLELFAFGLQSSDFGQQLGH